MRDDSSRQSLIKVGMKIRDANMPDWLHNLKSNREGDCKKQNDTPGLIELLTDKPAVLSRSEEPVTTCYLMI